jgi:hypothetical protein
MTIPRPKILSVITVPTGGWSFKFYYSVSTQYDTNKTATIAAGDYFMGFDAQSDDLLFALETAIEAALASATKNVLIDISPTTHKVKIAFTSTDFAGGVKNNVKLAWTESTAGLCQALGFSNAADDTSTGTDNPHFTADYHHGYGWYADEDGLLNDLLVEDITSPQIVRARAINGGIDSQYIGAWYDNALSLQFLSRAKTFSRQQDYGGSSIYPYERNEGLECWFRQAMLGKRFRVYRNGNIDTTRSNDRGTATSDTTTVVTHSTKSWGTDPQRWAGCLLYKPNFCTDGGTTTKAYYISSNTATTLTVANAAPAGCDVLGYVDLTYHLFDITYQTYVLGLGVDKFDPKEIPAIDRYNFKVPLSRYVA